MMKSNLGILTLAAASLILLAMSWRWREQAVSAAADLALLEAEHARWTARLVPVTPARSVTANDRTGADGSTPVPKSGRAQLLDALTPEQQRARTGRDPHLQVLELKVIGAKLQTTYGPFFRTLPLSLEEREALYEIWAQREMMTQDLRAIARKARVSGSLPEIQAMSRAADEAMREAELRILGEAGFNALQQYKRVQPVRDFVTRFAGNAALMGIPVSSEQAEQLTAMIAAADPRYGPGSRPALARVNWHAVDAANATVLTFEQRALLNSMVHEGTAQRKLASLVFSIKGR